MTDELGGTSTARVPAWKLRQQQQQQRQFRSPSSTDELGGGRSLAGRRRSGDDDEHDDELGSTQRTGSGSGNRSSTSSNELDGTIRSGAGGGARIPAWKLREQMKRGGGTPLRNGSSDSYSYSDPEDSLSVGTTSTAGSSIGSRSGVSCHTSRTVSRVPGGLDPSLPPGFRAAFRKQQDRRQKKDDFLSLNSVHSRTTMNSCGSNGSDSYGSLNDDSDCDDSFDGEDSFASLDSDADEDDDAYRESRNQMARLEIERQNQSRDARRGGTTSRFKKKAVGVHGTPLDFIAE